MHDLISKYEALIGDNPLFHLLSKKKKHIRVSPPSKSINPFVFRSTPGYINGTLRDYQISGLNWLIHMHSQSINCILADEMGLGKTLQTITFLGYLKEIASVKKPHLLIVPKSTLQNWVNEFNRFYTSFRIFVFHCSKNELSINKKKLKRRQFDIVITTYEMCINSRTLNSISYTYIIIDEAHRIKNENSKLSQFVRNYNVENRLLITGTPLQNNLRELWALLNFLIPELFNDPELFDEWLETKDKPIMLDMKKQIGRPKKRKVEVVEDSNEEFAIEDLREEERIDEETKNTKTINKNKNEKKTEKKDENSNEQMKINALRQVIIPFFLRREKIDVEVSLLPKKIINLYPLLTEMQKLWYRTILRKDIVGNAVHDKAALMNVVCQLRKVCNHPYLFDGAEPEPFTTDEHLVQNAGKMVLLDELLKMFKAQNSKVLLFSQMSRMLDILEDYCLLRDFEYRRLDGSTSFDDRNQGIEDFNNDESVFIYLLTTRAGGLGINLTAADIVIIYDSDWNPQMDLQAMDRAHRIGQTKEVKVFRFVSTNTIEEKIIERCLYKLKLDECLIRAKKQDKMDKKELLGIIATGIDTLDEKVTDAPFDIYEFLKEGEKRTNELNKKVNGANLTESTALDLYKFEGEDYKKISRKLEEFTMTTESMSRRARSRKVTRFYDYQFCPTELRSILVVECDRDLTPEELVRKEHYMKEVFHFDNYRFYQYLKCCEILGKDIDEIIKNLFPVVESKISPEEEIGPKEEISPKEEIGPKEEVIIKKEVCEIDPHWCESEVRRYHEVFWKRYTEVSEIDKSLVIIEKAESKRIKNISIRNILSQKFKEINLKEIINNEDKIILAFSDLKITYSQNTRSKYFTDIVDKTLLLLYYFLNDINTIWLFIKKISWLRTDYYIRSRDNNDIAKRLKTLTELVLKNEMVKSEKTDNSKDVS